MSEEKPFSLGIKFSIKESKRTNKDKIALQHTDGRNAFYTMEYKTTTKGTSVVHNIIIYYGKLGTTGRGAIESFKTQTEARNFFNTKLKEKLKKGYKVV